MRMLVAALFVSLFAVGEVSGQEFTVVVPNGLEDVEGNDGVGVGGLVSDTGVRFQVVYEVSQFASLPASHGLITSYLYRPDGPLGFPFSFTQPGGIIRLSTTSKSEGNLSLNFSQNVGDDEMIVLQSDVLHETANTGPPGGPKDFDYGFVFENNFPYDPSKGNLLLDVTFQGRTVEWGGDQHQMPGGPTEFVYAGTPGAGTAWSRGRTTNVVQFTFVPEPSFPGDHNNNGAVEQADLDLVLLNWGSPDSPIPEGWINDSPTADFVDQDDLDGVLLNWGNSATSNAAVVPEPSSILLLAVGAAGLGSWRRRKSVT